MQEEPEQEPERRSYRWLLIGALGILVLGAIAGLGFVAVDALGSDGNETASTGDDADGTADDAPADATTADDTAADTDGSATDGTAADDAGTDTSAAGATEDADGADSEGATADAEESDADSTDGDASSDVTAPRGGEPVDNSDGSIRYAVLEGGKLYLRGRVHSAEYGQAIEQVALGVMGPGNVINEYEVDPSTPDVLGGPIYVEDVVLFEFNSIAIAEPFLPILDLGTLLMTQNPSVTMQVITRTDSVGSEAVNLEVAQMRGEAIVRYWQRQGIDPARITVVPKGEEEATGEGADANLDRRAEFVIDNLFG